MQEGLVGPIVDARVGPLPQRAVLEGATVRLEPLDAGRHAGSLWRHTSGSQNDSLFLSLGDGPFADAESHRKWVEQVSTSKDPLFWAIVDVATGDAVGRCSLMRIVPEDRVIEIGNILYSPALQQTRGATEAMYLLARYVFEDLGYRRYEWKCHSMNLPSRRAAKRLGFTYEGTFRQHRIVRGRNRDTAWFSMLDSEWPVRKAEFERWLAAENFDAEGAQRTPLTMPEPTPPGSGA